MRLLLNISSNKPDALNYQEGNDEAGQYINATGIAKFPPNVRYLFHTGILAL